MTREFGTVEHMVFLSSCSSEDKAEAAVPPSFLLRLQAEKKEVFWLQLWWSER